MAPSDRSAQDRTISQTAIERIRELCERLEKSWKAGAPLAIHELLLQVDEKDRPLLLRELLLIEKFFRGDNFRIQEYRQRFPEYAAVFETTFKNITDSDFEYIPISLPLPQIPGYHVESRLDSGGMGIIYCGTHLALDMPVAIKMIRATHVTAGSLIRFQLEAQAIAKLNHPNIIRIFECGIHEGLPYYTMEYANAGSLASRLSGNKLSPVDAALLVESLARTMDFVHSQHLVHRDLKPANILLHKLAFTRVDAMALTPGHASAPIQSSFESPALGSKPFLATTHQIKVADFGLVKRLNEELALTHSATIMGTASYMSPEQAAGNANSVGPGTDIYSLGAILYECLTGQPPFSGPTYAVTTYKVMTEEPLEPHKLDPQIPPDLEAICLKCLEKKPEDRYPTAQALADDLRRFINGEIVSVTRMDVLERDTRWARRINYEILDLLGCNRWVFQYRAKQIILNRRVLLKLSTGMIGSDAHARLRRESEVLASLAHSGIQQLYDYGEIGGQPFLVLEYLDGATIRRILRADSIGNKSAEPFKTPSNKAAAPRTSELHSSPLPGSEALRIIIELTRIVQYMHEQGVIHGGITSSDIYVMKDRSIKLSGFGLARRIDRPTHPPADPAGSLLLPYFLSPEQIGGRWHEMDFPSDIYSLGAVLYDMLTGEPPFLQVPSSDLTEAILYREPTPLSTLNPGAVSAALERICLKCLAKDPQQRYRSAAELGAVLHSVEQALQRADEETISPGMTSYEGLADVEYQIRFLDEETNPSRIYLLPRRRTLIGRSSQSDIILTDPYCSRSHCAFTWSEDTRRHYLVDFGSVNGVFVNGVRVRDTRMLSEGDVIRIGSTRLQFERQPGNNSDPSDH